ncbi:MAG TPA: hypothetical protein VF466_04270 [Candidatus Saccharimonadales bacterium]
MAEPARQLSQFDDEEQQNPAERPRLRGIEGGGESTPERGNLRLASSSSPMDEDQGTTAQEGVRPRLRALEGGGESSPGKGKLSLVGKNEESGGNAAGRALGSAELGGAEHNDQIGGLYKAAGISPDGTGQGGNKLMVRLKGVNRRRKLLAGAGVGGFAGLLISLMIVSPIYRIPALLNDVSGKVGQEVDDLVEHRAERMIINYLLSKAGKDTTQYVVTGSPLSDLWRTMQSRRIEQKIFDKTGIQFKKIGNVVHVLHDGRDIGGVRNYEEVQAIIERGTIQTKSDFRQILKTVLPAARFHKASIEAKSFKRRFLRGGSYGTPKPVEDKAKTAAQNATQDVENLTAQQIDEGVAGSVDVLGDALTCTLDGEACDVFEQEDPGATVPDPNTPEAKQDLANGSSDEVKNEVAAAKDEAKTEAVKDREGGFVSRIIEKVLAKVIGAAAAKTATAAIPYIGWIDLLATLQHAIGNALANGLLYRIPVIIKENVYGAIYTAWVGYADQAKAGRMALTQLTALSQQIAGAEKGETYHLMYDNKTGYGVQVKPKVGSDKYDDVGAVINDIYNSFGVRWIIRGPLEAWYYTVGKLFKLVGNLGGDFIGFLLRITGFTAAWESTMKAIFGDNWKEELAKFAVKVIMDLYGISIDPLAKGAEMMNNIFVGAAVALNYQCHFFLGCQALTQQQGLFLGGYLDQQHAQDMAETPLKQRLFSPDIATSITSNIIRSAPADMKPGSVMASLFGQVARLPSSLTSAFSPKARAMTIDQMSTTAGVQWFGVLPQDQNKDTAPEVRQQQSSNIQCPTTDPTKEPNLCEADSTIIRSLNCNLDPNNQCPEFAH